VEISHVVEQQLGGVAMLSACRSIAVDVPLDVEPEHGVALGEQTLRPPA
jgi:hypothetical protein